MNSLTISLLMTVTPMKHKSRILITIIWLIPFLLFGQPGNGDFPSPYNPPRLVNDYAEFLSESEYARLEQKLEQFARETSTQIAVIIVPSLHGYDKADYAFRLAEQWGIGQEGKNNGILILVKPKTADERGEVFIATGYGLEGAVPDAVAKRIVEADILPLFRAGKYFDGLDRATNTIMELTRGEYTADEYLNRTASSTKSIAGIIFFLFVFLFVFLGRVQRVRHAGISHNIPFWTLLFLAGSGSRSNRGYFNNFSSGGGSFGGFGGFGGGSFGGGGAGGSW